VKLLNLDQTQLKPLHMKISITFLTIMLQVVFTGAIQAAEKTWTGANSSSWNIPSNWQPAGVPSIADDVVFNGSISNTNCALPSSVVIKSMQVLSSYSGTITGNNSSSAIYTVTNNLQISGGTFSVGLSKFKVVGNVIVDGGNLTKSSGGICTLNNLTISSGAFTIQDAAVEVLGNLILSGGIFQTGSGSFTVKTSYQQSGGTFSKTAGIGLFNPTGAVIISGGVFTNTNAAITFKSLNLSNATLNGGNAATYFNGNLEMLNASFSKLSGALYMNSNAALNSNNSTINLGSATCNANAILIQGGSANFGSGSLIVNGNGIFNNTTLIKSSGNALFENAYAFSAQNSSITFGTGTVQTGNLNLDATILNMGSNNFTVNGALSMSGLSQLNKSTGFAQLAYTSSVQINDGAVNLAGCSQINSGNWKQLGGSFSCGASPLFVNGNLEISNEAIFNAPSSTMRLQGNFIQSGGTFSHNNGTVSLTGTSSNTYSILGEPSFYKLEMQNTSGVNAKTIEIYGTVNVNQELSFKNASALNRSIRVNIGTINLLGNINISSYRSSDTNPGSGIIQFSGSNSQAITGTSLNNAEGILPELFINKTGGSVLLNGNLNLGNGFAYQNSSISFDPNMILNMQGGEFALEGLVIPLVRVSGPSSLNGALVVLGNLEILSSGILNNGNSNLNVNGSMLNSGKYFNLSGSLSVSGTLSNSGEFSANTGTVNALSGIIQEQGIFSCIGGQVNSIGTLKINNGVFNCANGLLTVNGSIIQNGGQLDGNTNGGTLTVSQNFTQVDGIFNGQSGVLNIAGSLSLAGLFNRGTGTIHFNGIGPQTIPALYYNKLSIAGTGRLITLAPSEIKIGASTAGFAPNSSNIYTTSNNTINYCASGNQDVAGFAYNNLSLSRTGTKSLSTNASVKNTLQVVNSSVFDADGVSNNRIFTMLSNQSQTARIDQIPSSASIVGNMTVQRWTRGGIRSNRFIASPVDTVGGIKFKQIKDNILLFGPGNTASGWDNPSTYTTNVWVYNETASNGTEWRSPANTNEVLPKGSGFLLYYLGVRGQSTIVLPSAGIIDFKGVPNQGDVQLPVTCSGDCFPVDNGNGWSLVANPYQSPIDWNSAEWTKNGISSTIYIWNPSINQYASYNSANPGAATNGGSRYIGPGQSFFIKSTANNPVLTAHETIKTSTFPDSLFFRMSAPQEQLRLMVKMQGSDIQDEAIIEFHDQASEAFNPTFDAYKPELPGMDLNFSLLNELGDALSVHAFAKPDLTYEDKIIPVKIKAVAGTYDITAEQLESFGNDVQFFIEDRYNKNITKLEEGKRFSFEVNSNPETSQLGRLNIIIRQGKSNASISTNNSIRVFPNPSNGDNIQVMLPKAEKGSIEIFNMLGAKVVSQNYETNQNTIQLENMNQVPAGVYTVIWNTADGKFSDRLTIK
jgi:hypothetical protein